MVETKLIQRLINGHNEFINYAVTAENYYKNSNDITRTGASKIYQDEAQAEINPLKTADNRISVNWHALLVDQKNGYLFTYPPLIDVGNDEINKKITDILGDKFGKVLKDVGTDASNCGIGWLHYWLDGGKFKYSKVDPKQIIPIYSNNLEEKLIGVLRAYRCIDEDGKAKQRCEYWDSEKVRFFEEESSNTYVPFFFPDVGEEMRHDCGAVPFIPFYNNSMRTSDLDSIKTLIDAYDRTLSGFANDIDDVQEIIFVLKNYGGTDKDEFIKDLRLNKMIKVDDDGGVDTIRAEVPYEARTSFLEIVRKQIFVSGRGVDPEAEKIGNASGESLKFLYSLLEGKAGLTESEFRLSVSELVKAVCRTQGIQEPKLVEQTWTRNKIKNDMENAQIAAQSKNIISDKSILKNHPWVDNVEEEMQELKEQRDEAIELQKKQFGMVENTPLKGDNIEE